MAQKTKTQQSEEPRKQKTRTFGPYPPGKPADYRTMRVYPNTQVGHGEWIFELVYDEWKNRTWEQLGEYIRRRPSVQNETIHVRCYGGPQGMKWFIPKKTLSAVADSEGIDIGEVETLRRRVFELENRDKDRGTLTSQLKKILSKGINETTLGAALDLLKAKREPELVEEEPPKSLIRESLDDLEEMLGPDVFSYLGHLLKHTAARAMGVPMPHEQQSTQRTQPIADPLPVDHFAEINFPDAVVREMARIDWDKTDADGLVEALHFVAPSLGIKYLQDTGGLSFENSNSYDVELPQVIFNEMNSIDWAETDADKLLGDLRTFASRIGVHYYE